AVVSGSFDLRSSPADAAAIIAAAEEMRKATSLDVRLIQIDTVSRVLAGGDENGPKDMGALVNNLAKIQLDTKAHVMALHHIPIDGQQRMRGHGALLGACDTTIGVEKAAGGIRTATVQKQNDGPEDVQLGFNIESVDLSIDSDTGDVTTAPVAIPI